MPRSLTALDLADESRASDVDPHGAQTQRVPADVVRELVEAAKAHDAARPAPTRLRSGTRPRATPEEIAARLAAKDAPPIVDAYAPELPSASPPARAYTPVAPAPAPSFAHAPVQASLATSTFAVPRPVPAVVGAPETPAAPPASTPAPNARRTLVFRPSRLVLALVLAGVAMLAAAAAIAHAARPAPPQRTPVFSR